jgi:hypothetical protein
VFEVRHAGMGFMHAYVASSKNQRVYSVQNIRISCLSRLEGGEGILEVGDVGDEFNGATSNKEVVVNHAANLKCKRKETIQRVT